MPLLEVKNLNVSFQTYLGKVKATKNISFSMEKGEIVAIVGESGCGKSVTAHSIMGLIPHPPGNIDEGQILFEGKDLLHLSKRQMQSIRGKDIGMVFQDPMTSLNPTMRIGKQIMEGLVSQGSSFKEAEARACEMLELVGISEPEKRLNQYPFEFSGGMRQRVMIAIALCSRPKLLIADEPTTALDVTIQAQLLDLLKKQQKQSEMSILLITHDLGIVASLCDRVIVMYNGQIVESAHVMDLYASARHPYTQGLLNSIPRLDMDKKKKLAPIWGSPPSMHHCFEGCSFTPRCDYAMRICQLKPPNEKKIKEGHIVKCWLHDKPQENESIE